MQLMPGTADYIARKSGGTRFVQGDLADAADQHRLRLLVPALPAPALRRQRRARARRLQRGGGQGRRVVAAGGRPRREVRRRQAHPVPRDARRTSPRSSTPATRTAANTRTSSGCEPPAAGHGPASRCRRSATAPGESAAASGWARRTTSHVRALNRAIDLGVTLIDTALAYGDGHSEQLVGARGARALRASYVATKIPPKNGVWPAPDGIDPDEAFPADYVVACAEREPAQPRPRRVDLQQFHVWSDEWVDARELARRRSSELKAAGQDPRRSASRSTTTSRRTRSS